jgi:hypothetical protein
MAKTAFRASGFGWVTTRDVRITAGRGRLPFGLVGPMYQRNPFRLYCLYRLCH